MRKLMSALLFVTALVLGPVAADAQDEARGQSYITPFPEGDTYKMVVIGDWLAEGLVGAISDQFGGDVRLQIQRKHKPIGSVGRGEFDDEIKALDDGLAKDGAHIAVLFIGTSDRVNLRSPAGKRATVGSEDWKEEYGRRIDRLMKVLKKRNVATYIVGQPIVRKSEANDDIQVQNEVLREKGYINGFKFIDIYAGFADESGSYVAHGPDLTGKIRVMRAGDGIGFTADGNRKLAHFVERDIKRDLTQAKADRSIPLAGSETEQRKINPEKVALAPPAPGAVAAAAAAAVAPGMSTKVGKETKSWTSTVAPAVPVPAGAAQAGGERADNSRVALKMVGANGREEVVTLDIVRPAISASIIAMVTRRESPDKPSLVGDSVSETIGGGLVVLSSITPNSASSSGKGRAKIGLTQTPFFRVMVKGERLPPKPGRSDDVSWPRQEMVEAPPPTAVRSDPAAQSGDRKGQPPAKTGQARQPRG